MDQAKIGSDRLRCGRFAKRELRDRHARPRVMGSPFLLPQIGNRSFDRWLVSAGEGRLQFHKDSLAEAGRPDDRGGTRGHVVHAFLLGPQHIDIALRRTRR